MNIFTPVCVESDNGKYYINPIISGDDYFIHFEGNKPPELIIKKQFESVDYHKHATNILQSINLQAIIPTEPEPIISKRFFDKPLHHLNFTDAIIFPLDIQQPIPFQFITRHDGIYKDDDQEVILYHWPKKIQPILPIDNGQRIWPTKPPWLSAFTPKQKKSKNNRKSDKPEFDLKKTFFMPTTKGGKIASIIKSQTNESFTLYVYNHSSLTFDIEVTVPNLKTPIDI